MKRSTAYKTLFSIIVITTVTTRLALAQPAGPGDGGDPFAAPVNGGLAFVVIIAFLYGMYRIMDIKKKKYPSANN